MKLLIPLSLIASAFAANEALKDTAKAPNCPPRPAARAEQEVIFDQFVNSFYVKKNVTEAFLNHVAESYIQHNPNFLSGRDNAMNGLKDFIPKSRITVVATAVSDNKGWILLKQENPGAAGYRAVLDLFRLDGTCVVEHWDLAMDQPKNAKNPLALFNGQTFSTWAPKQAGPGALLI